MKGLFYISLIILVNTSFSCQSQNTQHEIQDKNILPGDLYISDFGQVRIHQINDTLFNTYFTNNEGHQFDTSMVLIKNDSVFLHPFEDKNSFTLRYNWGGLYFYNNQIQVYDFAGYGMLGAQTQMWDMYSRPFYKEGSRVTIQAEFGNMIKDTAKNDLGLIIEPRHGEIIEKAFYNITGLISKESYEDQWKKEHFSLILKNCTFEKPDPSIFKGTTINISTGEAAIAWGLADSEAYILDGHEPWTMEEELKDIVVEGILVQNEKGSYLKNWKIIE